jgi:hypothetical protein
MNKDDKKEYKTPKLRVYGDLRKITQKKRGNADSLAMIS